MAKCLRKTERDDFFTNPESFYWPYDFHNLLTQDAIDKPLPCAEKSTSNWDALTVEFDGSTYYTVKRTHYPHLINCGYALFVVFKQRRNDLGTVLYKSLSSMLSLIHR